MSESGTEKKIRLIASDLDGCLMDEHGLLPGEFKEAFDLMEKNDVLFAASSGRSFRGVVRPFEDIFDKIALVSDNGARVTYKGETLYSSILDSSDFLPVVEEMRKVKGLLPVACGEKGAYVERRDSLDRDMEEELKKYFSSWNECSFDNIPDRIVKFAVLYFDDIEKNIYPLFKRFDNDKLCVQVTAYIWMDIYEKGISKGKGIKILQDALKIDPSETVVFGDYLNDLDMADYATRSFAPANAHPEVRERFTGTIGPNTENGVTKKIISLLS